MRWVFLLIAFWLIFVLSLAGWWLYFGISTIQKIPVLIEGSDFARHQQMLFLEGIVLFAFLLLGGLSLFYLSYRLYKEKTAKERFFASFTHDLKTALFRLQLQVEKIGHDLGDDSIDPILVETRKMHLDLENGLDSTLGRKKEIYLEEIDLKNFLYELHTQWPEFHFKISGDNALVKADAKALQSVFKNLLHNSLLHGESDEINVNISANNGSVKLDYSDNGKAFVGELSELGSKPLNSAKGTGFGLYIVHYWIERMSGELVFYQTGSGSLGAKISLLGRAA